MLESGWSTNHLDCSIRADSFLAAISCTWWVKMAGVESSVGKRRLFGNFLGIYIYIHIDKSNYNDAWFLFTKVHFWNTIFLFVCFFSEKKRKNGRDAQLECQPLGRRIRALCTRRSPVVASLHDSSF